MPVALYARVSTETQEKEATIESRLAKLRDFALQHGYTWTQALTYIDEGYSGTRLDRPALDQLRDDAREGRFGIVLVTCPDRLARRYAYQVAVLEELTRAGCTVLFCERPIAETPDDQLLLQIQGVIAEYERAKILERTRRGRLHRARLPPTWRSSCPTLPSPSGSRSSGWSSNESSSRTTTSRFASRYPVSGNIDLTLSDQTVG
jgi:site-specific DNA recombinase